MLVGEMLIFTHEYHKMHYGREPRMHNLIAKLVSRGGFETCAFANCIPSQFYFEFCV